MPNSFISYISSNGVEGHLRFSLVSPVMAKEIIGDGGQASGAIHLVIAVKEIVPDVLDSKVCKEDPTLTVPQTFPTRRTCRSDKATPLLFLFPLHEATSRTATGTIISCQ